MSRTSTELHVEWNHLKRRMAARSGTSSKPAPPRFVELVAPRGESLPECAIELEGRVIDHLKSSFSEHEPEASDIIGAAGANHLSDHRPRS